MEGRGPGGPSGGVLGGGQGMEVDENLLLIAVIIAACFIGTSAWLWVMALCPDWLAIHCAGEKEEEDDEDADSDDDTPV